MSAGIVYLVGAGPGDPGLMTLRGAELLKTAEVVVYDHLASARLLDLAPPTALKVRAGKSIGHRVMAQDLINQTLAEHAGAGRRVVRLKGGDPFIFGRGAEEAEFLQARGIPFEVVPGVTAAVGVSAYAGIPLTHRDDASAVALVTGHGDPESREGLDWDALVRFPGTLVVYMGVTHLSAHCRSLIRRGKPAETPAAFVSWGTLPRQGTVIGTLDDLPDRVARSGLGAPALLIVGRVVARRSALNWYESGPLFGRTIVITRPIEEAARSAAPLEALGAEVLFAPTVTIGPPPDLGPLDDAIDRLAEFDWLVFTSGQGVRWFLDRLEARGRDLRALGRLKLAAIGPSTAEALARARLRADLVPSQFRSESLAEAIAERARGCEILLAQADRGRAVLKEELDQVATVEQVAVYSNRDAERLPDEVAERLVEGTVDWITLTSPAIAERLHALVPEPARSTIGKGVKIASLSPLTSGAARRLGWDVQAEARISTWEGLIAAIVGDEFKRGGGGAVNG
jgi:uroporphyrinogen III methyltransferase/synthase